MYDHLKDQCAAFLASSAVLDDCDPLSSPLSFKCEKMNKKHKRVSRGRVKFVHSGLLYTLLCTHMAIQHG